ncbi:hypothetical protein MHU86_24859 [Fragilaria crotonensis]|nr:hypothetical protein MHU86_24859 [Fragilaria crotonensis]
MDNSDITDEGVGRLSLVPRLEGRRFRPPSTIACDPKTRGDCPRFRTDIAVGIVRFPRHPSLRQRRIYPSATANPRRLDDIVRPSPAAWQVRSARRHFVRQEWDGDHAPRRGDNPTPDQWQQSRARPPPRTLRPQKRQSTRCLARTVQLLQKKRTRQERIDNNARPLTTIASASSSRTLRPQNDNQPAAWRGLCSCCRRNARSKKGSTTTQ